MAGNGVRAPTLEDLQALLQRAQGAADSVALTSEVVELIQALPPPQSEILSRPFYERGSLWTLGVSFENVAPDDVPTPQNVLMPHDMWIRGVVAQAYWKNPAPDVGGALVPALVQRLAPIQPNNRGLFEVGWRIDARQGFISSGQAEINASAQLVAGDGQWAAPMDWRLEKNQTVEVRLRSRMRDFIPLGLPDTTDDARILRWVVVAFWGEELRQPSVQ